MIKGIIIDDEINSVELLEHLINDNCPDIDIIAAETSPKKGIELIEKHKPDVVFLDIEMPDMSGFELLELLKHLSFHVIFITAYDNYAIKAFKYNTIDYLLKPIIVGELTAAVDKLMVRTQSNNSADISIQKLLETIRTVQNQSKLAINALNEIVYVDINNIIRLESDSNYTHVILVDGKKIVSSKTLKEYETILDSGIFFRTHKTCIINLNHVQKYIKTDGGYIVTKDNFQVPISREKRTALLDALARR
ncbi:MAG TPA: LytTR family DNA-binding domain-containing protein [Bacteroidia bacterium]|jgi:two-component system LytT family response regulator|nr:LytTR family DNA-binding domain-containing protein [Bacteroidia bacterium]